MGIANIGAMLNGNKSKQAILPVADQMDVNTAHIRRKMVSICLNLFFFGASQFVFAEASKMNFNRIEKLITVTPIKATEMVFMC